MSDNLVSFADFKKFRKLKKAEMAKKLLSKNTMAKTTEEKTETLISSWMNKDQAYCELVHSLLESDNQEIFNSAAYQIELRHDDNMLLMFGSDMVVLAESTTVDGIQHRIVALPVCFNKGILPDTTEVIETLLQTEVFPQYTDTVFLSGWREYAQVNKLSPTAIRHVLKDIVLGLEPLDIPETKIVSAQGGECFVLMGVQSHNEEAIVPQEVDNWNIRFDREYSALMEWNKAIKEHYPVIKDVMPPVGISGLEESIDIYHDQNNQELEIKKFSRIQNFVETTLDKEISRLNTKVHQAIARMSFERGGLHLFIISAEGHLLNSLKLTSGETPKDGEELVSFLKTMVTVQMGQPVFKVYDNSQYQSSETQHG